MVLFLPRGAITAYLTAVKEGTLYFIYLLTEFDIMCLWSQIYCESSRMGPARHRCLQPSISIHVKVFITIDTEIITAEILSVTFVCETTLLTTTTCTE